MGVLSVYSVFCEGSVFMLARKKDPAGLVGLLLTLSTLCLLCVSSGNSGVET